MNGAAAVGVSGHGAGAGAQEDIGDFAVAQRAAQHAAGDRADGRSVVAMRALFRPAGAAAIVVTGIGAVIGVVVVAVAVVVTVLRRL